MALRVVEAAPDHALLEEHPELLSTLQEMADTARSLFASATAAWAGQDLALACTLATQAGEMERHGGAVAGVLVGRALERVADHTLTGEPAHLAAEVR